MRLSRLGSARTIFKSIPGDRSWNALLIASTWCSQRGTIPNEQRRYRAAVPVDHHFVGGEEVFKEGNNGSGQRMKSNAAQARDQKTEDSLAPRNPVGVQLLSPSLYAQIFPPTTARVPLVQPEALSLSQHHLHTHGLQPEQASTLKPINFDLPPLQGDDLSQHFWNLGRQAAQPWLGMAHNLAADCVQESIPEEVANEQSSSTLSEEENHHTLNTKEWLTLDSAIRDEFKPILPKWIKKPGWVRYPVLRSEDGKSSALGDGEQVDYPLPEDGSLVFDVETMIQESQFAVMATAAGLNAWYAWLSPWLLQEGNRHEEKDHLIPFGPNNPSGRSSQPARLLIGHNVGYDRARIQDEYTLKRGNLRFLDTMSLHVATRGISSPQRGAWIRHNKGRALEKMLDQDDVEDSKKSVIRSILGGEDVDEDVLAGLDLDQLVYEMQKEAAPEATVPLDDLSSDSSKDNDISSSISMAWQDVTSKNSLADVAKLHCNIELSKEARNVFIDGTSREEILGMLNKLLTYCATDVLVTHKVFRKVWPAFVQNCPNPATVAGVLGLGSPILPVDDEWIDYIQRCDVKYESALNDVWNYLVQLAEQLRTRGTEGVSWDQAMEAAEVRLEDMDGMKDLTYADKLMREERERLRPKLWWEKEKWASQLDWTPKKPKKDKSMSAITDAETDAKKMLVPRWYRDKVLKSASGIGPTMALAPTVLRLHQSDRPIVKRSVDGKWVIEGSSMEDDIDLKGSPLRQAYLRKDAGFDVKSKLGKVGEAALTAIRMGSDSDVVRQCLREAADALVAMANNNEEIVKRDSQLALLDWTPSEFIPEIITDDADESSGELKDQVWWPKWYWDLYKPATGQLEVTIRTKVSPILLCVTWQSCPLHQSREHGWVFRYDPQESVEPLTTRQNPITFHHPADQPFRNDITRTVSSRLADAADKARGKDGEMIDPNRITPRYYKVPHVAGDGSNVGSPFSKGFLPLFEKGTLQSEHPDEKGRLVARDALEMNAQCSYWIGVRDRVRQQMVVWEGQSDGIVQFPVGISGARQDDESESKRKKGIILPPIIPMGTVTRRAIEKTWLTASNAKPNRVGSELKALVKAPPGWSIVGADVDSQELWICSVMGDAQFGMHGATAIGWMTLEGSKSMGTDLHSKTASILGTSRNEAKVFNYSRIYGAGIRHSSQLLLKANPTMSSEEATRKAKELYASTKGTNTQRSDMFGRKFWYGGTESYVFNKLEEIALSEQPKTPALDCGVTAALSKKYLPKSSNFGRGGGGGGGKVQGEGDYMPSRINWVVQSSGVDYLHLIITAMEHLISTYDLQARFMISVHDEVRYLAKDEDAHRVALALQISNLWTRSMFAHKLQMDNLPQGVAFFAQVDIDKVLRKEADDPCVTPSQPRPIPPGTAEDIYDTLSKTHGGSLHPDGSPMGKKESLLQDDLKAHLVPEGEKIDFRLPRYEPSTQSHRSSGDRGLRYLQAQASDNIAEISALEQRVKMSERQRNFQEEDPSIGSIASSRKGRASAKTVANARTRPGSDVRKKRLDSPFGSTMSLHTGAVITLPPSSTPSLLPASLAAIVDQFPPRPLRLRVPFYKTREHRWRILYSLYKPLVKECPPEYVALLRMIRGLTRARRHCTSPRKTNELIERGSVMLDSFQRQRAGDEEARKRLVQENEDIGRQQHERTWNTTAGRYCRSLEEEAKPRPRPSGALLPPTISNPPLLRFKPTQPDDITMMILKRITDRSRRIERQADNVELQRQVHKEVEMWSQIRSSSSSSSPSSDDWRDKDAWLEVLRKEKLAMERMFENDQKRSEMVFSTSMLQYAKRVRTRKQQWRTEKNKEKKRLL
ncbi:hypothetical protein CBS101457_001818 [Exobasidium rhododendri]|nr:hypothetical protein CBS101457_001818 [Exobasidium rhododendri]